MSKCSPSSAVAHRRALDVPAGPARRPTATPRTGSPGLARFQSTKSSGSCLSAVDLDALAGAQVVERLARELAVAGELAHRVVHVAVGRAVRERLALQRADHVEHLRRCTRVARGSWSGFCTPSAAASSSMCGDEALGQRADRSRRSPPRADDLVVDVGDVAHVGDVVAAARAASAAPCRTPPSPARGRGGSSRRRSCRRRTCARGPARGERSPAWRG